MKRFALSGRGCGLGLVLVFALAGLAPAATKYSNVVTGDWTAGGSWLGGVAPVNDTSTDVGWLSGGAVITVDAVRSVGCTVVGRTSGSATLNINQNFTVGTFNLFNGVSFFIGGGGGSGVANQAAGTTVQVLGKMAIGPDPGVTGSYAIGNGATLTVANGIWIGDNSSGAVGSGALTIDGGTVNAGSTANGVLLNVGTLTINNGALNASSKLDIGAVSHPNASLVINGGTVTVASQLVPGAHGVNSSVTQSGGALQVNGTLYLGGYGEGTGTGTFTQSGGTATVTGQVHFGGGGPNHGVYNLNGGTLTTPTLVKGGSGTATFNFGGGTLKPSASTATFLQGLSAANVKAGGGTVDTAGFNVTIAQVLQHDAGLGATRDGGLTKAGAGTLTFGVGHTFTGNLIVKGGTLSDTLAANNSNPTATGLGNMTVAGREIRVQDGATLLFSNNDSVGAATYLSPTAFVVDNAILSHGSYFVTIGNVTLMNGATVTGGNGVNVNYHEFNIMGTVTVSGTSGSTLTTTGSSNIGTHLGSGNVNFVVNTTGGGGADLTVSSPLLNKPGAGGAAATLTKSGAGAMALTVANSYTGGTTLNGGTLSFVTGALGPSGTITFSGSSTLQWAGVNTLDISSRLAALGAGAIATMDLGANNATFATALTGAGGLGKRGTGTLLLNATGSSFTGNIEINEGIVQASGARSLANPTSSTLGNPQTAGRLITINAGGTLSFQTHDVFGNAPGTTPLVELVVNGGTVDNGSARFITLGPVTLRGGTLTANGGDGNWGSYWPRGAVTVTGAAVSTIAAGVGANARFDIAPNPGTTFNVADATGDVNPDLTVTVPVGNPYTLVGMLVKSGAGTLALNAASSYTGDTMVNAGTLLVNNTHTVVAGNYTVNGGVLGGTGTIRSAISVGSGGTLTAGDTNTVATIHLNGNVGFLPGATLLVNIGAAGCDVFDLSGGAGAFSPSGATLRLVPVPSTYTPAFGQVFTFVTGFSGGLGSMFAQVEGAEILAGGASYLLHYNGAGGAITLTSRKVDNGSVFLMR